jgi:hypothetical protein
MNYHNIKYPGYNILWNGILCGPEIIVRTLFNKDHVSSHLLIEMRTHTLSDIIASFHI